MSPLVVEEIDDGLPASVSGAITWEPVEVTLKTLLLDVAKYIDQHPASPDDANAVSQVVVPDDLAKQPIVLRFTGGWVRDKLLAKKSHDIDVAINKMTGYQFGLRLKEYLELPGNLEMYGLESIASNDKQSQKAGKTDKSKSVGGLHKIEANPDKSKHLETTTMQILGLDIDLVNLRKETYTDEEGRIPQIEFGTPEEDAERRDATVNAMFYNLNEDIVEDFTGRGHDDMKSKIIRTPLQPYQTFKDDPLRVLRLIRFASRLGYTIEENALKAMENAEIKEALRLKISRERVGTELEKALQGPNPYEALRLIFSLDLYQTIYSDPAKAKADHDPADVEGWQVVIDTLQELIRNGNVLQEELARDHEEEVLGWQLAAIVPYRNAPLPEPTQQGKKPPPPIPVQVAREGIKATNKICDVINLSVRHQFEISNLVDRLYQKKRRPDKQIDGDDPAARDVLGMALRRWGGSWRSQVLYSLLVEVANDGDQVESIERRYTGFVQHLRQLDITEVCTFKPLMNGKELATAIGIKPGPWMTEALDVVMAWQLRNPDSTDAQKAIEEVKNHQANGELTSDLIRHFLKLTIRPLFTKAAPATVTEQGRKVTTERLPEKLTMSSMDDSTKKPWKSAKDAYSLDILKWVVHSLDEKTVADVWPMVIPPLLTLLDDWEARYKRIGADLTAALLAATPPPLLERTGLGEVFEQALMPCLTYLPTITSEQDSIPLLSSTYPALLTLAHKRFPPSEQPNTAPLTPQNRARTKLLDTIIRKGIIYGYTHCGTTHPAIATILFTHLAIYIRDLGIDCVKHLKFLIPMLSEALSSPLGTATVPMLVSATEALQAVIENAWPRMLVYRGEVLKGVTMCWIKIEDVKGTEELRGKLRETVRMLGDAVEGECEFEEEMRVLVGADGRLEGLLLQQE
ncbi:putative Poly A polymerase, head domain, Tti2 family, Nucleotidyltransferase superfamily [Septoria linicola]|nr:putative Poly A polymerase, head domain, Tti2 family, Nucleotidyltransferase superfamily [Septoria linicola]